MRSTCTFILFLSLFCKLSVVFAEDSSAARIHGENGWYVPKLDGTFEWYDMTETEAKMEKMQDMHKRSFFTLTPVGFYLYTAANPLKPQKISATIKDINKSHFNASNPTRFITHGWTQSSSSAVNTKIRDAWLKRGDYNIICVDWPRARFEYGTSVMAVPTVGEKVAEMIDFLVENYKLSLDELILIGHSLGAHVSGYAAKNVKTGKVHTIVGLDPALPLFNYNKPDKRLADTDAFYVESLTTNGGHFGFLKPIGKGAFYPNGGQSQPSCWYDFTGVCAHNICIDYYAEAVVQNSFPSYKCPDYQNAIEKKCPSGYSAVHMGNTLNAYMVNGNFYVPVNSKAPYGILK